MFKTNKELTFTVSLSLVIFIVEQIPIAVFAMDLILVCTAVEVLWMSWEFCVKIKGG